MVRPKKPLWLRPAELIKFCVNDLGMPVGEARGRLYWAVVDGEVRAARAGKYLTVDEIKALVELIPNNPKSRQAFGQKLLNGEVGLPSDIDLLVTDADRLWRRAYQRQRDLTHPPPPSDISPKISRSVGRPPEMRKKAVALIRGAITRKEISLAELQNMKQEALAKLCGVRSRGPALDGLREVLSENQLPTQNN